MNMNSDNSIQDELRDLNSSLPAGRNKPVFDLPEGYFESFAASVMAKIENEPGHVQEEMNNLSPVLAGIPRTMPYNVPEGYFTNLMNDVSKGLKADYSSPELDLYPKKLPYEVPNDYFSDLPGQILNKVRESKVKVIPLGNRLMKYAVAAMIASIITLSSIYYFNTKRESIALKEHPQTWIKVKLKDVSTQELEEFINTADLSPNGKELARTPASYPEVHKLLQDVDDKELDAFLATIAADSEDFSAAN